MKALLTIALEQNNIQLSDTNINALVSFLELIKTWNKVFNLTSITKPRDMVYLHLIDSLIMQPHLHGHRIIDIGSGAGLPGIPLAITNPDIEWTLLDKNNKKTRFMTQVAADLGLKNVKVVHSRVEDFHPEQAFDSIVSRAFTSLNNFCQSTSHLLAPDGLWLAMKGKLPDDEINALNAQFVLQNTVALDIKGVDIERHLLCLRQA